MASELIPGHPSEAHESAEALQPGHAPQTINAGTPLTIIEETGDLFKAPDHSVLIHACNCMGRWGSGIAREFQKRYPKAYALHKAHCRRHSPSELVGTALLIPPSELSGPIHRVGCIFTSEGYGANKDSVSDILEATKTSMAKLLDAVYKDGEILEMYMCRINSGAFGVPWERTKRVLEGLERNAGPIPHELRVLTPLPQHPKGPVGRNGRNCARVDH
jgi:ADP-ribose 1''-phosphate phosphatase